MVASPKRKHEAKRAIMISCPGLCAPRFGSFFEAGDWKGPMRQSKGRSVLFASIAGVPASPHPLRSLLFSWRRLKTEGKEMDGLVGVF